MKKLIITLILTAMLFSMVGVQSVGAADNSATLDVYSTGGGYLVMAEGSALAGKDLMFYAASFDTQNRMVGVESEEATVENGKIWANFAINAQKANYFDSIATTKFLLWDETTASPLTEVKTNSAATPVATVDAAASSAVFASSATDGHWPEAAVDGNVETYWEAYTEGASTATDQGCFKQRYIVDLGAEYPVNSIEYLPADEESAKMFDIFVTNDSQFVFSNVKYICAVSETAVSTTEATVFPVKDAGSYRYVVVEKIFGNGSLAIKDLKVNVPSEFYDVRVDRQNYLTDNVYGYRTANGKTASAFAYNVLGGKQISQTTYDAISLAIPLNNVSPVSHIALESGDTGTGENQFDFRSNFKILGLEAGECTLSGGQPVFDLADADVLVTQEGIAGHPTYGFSGLIIYDVPQQFTSKQYEYIVFYKDTKYNDKLQLRMNSVYVYNYQQAEEYDSVTDAASDSMVYTITNSTDHAGLNAVDNDPTTYYESGSATDAKRNSLVVDLGASYPIASIDYLPMNNDTAASNYSIYVSNDPQFAAKELVHSQGATVADKANATNYVVVGDTPYRYVLVEKETGKLGVAEINVNVPSEYYADAVGINRANFEIKNRGTKVWRSAMPNAVKAQVGQLNGENTLQTYVHTWNNLSETSTDTMYLYYDLGEGGAKVDTIAFADCASDAEPANLARRSDFKVVLSNNADLSNSVTVYTQNGIAGGNDGSKDSGLVLYHVPEVYKNNNYRYVGIYKDTKSYVNAAWSLRLGYGIMDIYTAKPKQVEYDSVTDAASDSMVYTITNSTGHAGAYAVDNDPATYYESGSATDAKRNNLVVDLGASYPIASIDYLPMNDDTAASNYSIYVSNDPQFATKELVHSQGATVADKTNATNYPMYDETPYRYVLVENETGKLGIAEINVNVPSEYYADAAGVSRANFEIKNRGTKVWRSKTSTLSNAQVGQLNGENTLQTYEHFWNELTSDSTEVLFMYYDLGASGAKVDTIAYADYASGTDASNLARRSNFKVILSNNVDLSNGVTIYTQTGVAGGNDGSKDSGIVLYHVPEAYKNTNYRYVGIYKDATEYINASWRLKLGYGIMDIYTQK
ncbi:MAG: discoidin domain-containing protein [Clostridia bacterium]|nr:discoidin domain-containing protein [Clostridia bacterium]